jgi:hypothetical protein
MDSMGSEMQGCEWKAAGDAARGGWRRSARRWGLLAVAACWAPACNPPSPSPAPYSWPPVTSLGIWAVSPSSAQVLGLNGNPLYIKWNDAVPSGSSATISLRLLPLDPNQEPALLVSGLEAVIDASGDEWPFSGTDADGLPVSAGQYQVEYTIQDDEGHGGTTTSSGAITVPLQFTSPATDISIYLSTLQADGVEFAWVAKDFVTYSRLDIGLSKDPNDPNDVVWTASTGILLETGPGSETFQGTVYGGADPNGVLITPATYVVIGRIIPTGTGLQGFFFEAPGRLTILPDVNP